MFLHEYPKFKDLIETIAFEQKLPPAIVEKDYWVMHALWGLSENGLPGVVSALENCVQTGVGK